MSEGCLKFEEAGKKVGVPDAFLDECELLRSERVERVEGDGDRSAVGGGDVKLGMYGIAGWDGRRQDVDGRPKNGLLKTNGESGEFEYSSIRLVAFEPICCVNVLCHT
jgi:hypothetical protein